MSPAHRHADGLSWIAIPLLAADGAGVVQYANEAFHTLLGENPGTLQGSALGDLILHEESAQWLARALAGDTTIKPLVSPLRAADGTPRATVLRIIPTVSQESILVSATPVDSENRRELVHVDWRAMLEYHAIMLNAPIAIGFSQNKRIVHYNSKCGELFGFQGDEGVGQPSRVLYPSDEIFEEVGRVAGPLLSAGRPYHAETLFQRQDGSCFWGEAYAYLVDPADPPQGTIWIFNDISERRTAEEVQRKVLLELDAIFTNASVGILYSRDRIIQRCNLRMAEILGYAPKELLGQPGMIIYPSQEAYEELGREAGPLLAAGESFSTECDFRRKDGSLVWCRVFAKAYDREHTQRGTIWIVDGIEETRRAQIALKATLRELEAIMNNASVGILFTRDREIRRYNPRFAEMFGVSSDGMVGLPARLLVESDEEYEALGRAAFPMLSSGKPFQTDLMMRRHDGRVFCADVIAYLIDSADPLQGTIWIINDVSAQRAAAETQRQTLLELDAIFTNASVGIIHSRNLVLQRCNPRAAEILGYSPGELVGRSMVVIAESEEASRAQGIAAGPLLAAGKSYTGEARYRRKDGSLVWCRFLAKALDPDNLDRGIIWIGEDIEERREAQDQLNAALRELEAIMNNASVGILLTHERKIQRYNRKFAEMFGFDESDALGRPGRLLYRSDEEYAEVGRLASPLLSAAQPFHTELYMRRQDGSDIWVNLIGYVRDPDDPTQGTIWLLEDRSAFKRTDEALQAAYAEQQLILDHSVVGVAFVRDRVVQRCNRRYAEIYGYSQEELGRLPTRERYLSDSAWEEIGKLAYPAMARGETYSAEVIHQRRNGEPFWVRITGKAVDPADPHAGSIWNMEDITAHKLAQEALLSSRNDLEVRVVERTAELAGANVKLEAEVVERRRAERRLRHLAHHDSLTGLANRNLLQSRVEEAITDAGTSGRVIAVIFLDLDRFKTINDSLGHHVGDMLLRKVATRLAEALRAGDTVARIGGDEFVILAPELESPEEAAPLAERVHAAFREPITVAAHELYVTPSIGIALYPKDGTRADTLMRNADTAMYRAKASGRNAICAFSEEMKAAAEQYFQIESSLRRGIERNELVLHFQPIVDCNNGALRVLEALVRWQHPTLGLLLPAEFVAVAEECGLIGTLGDWVLVTACRQIAAWRRAGLPTVPVAINLSGHQFRDAGLARRIESILAETGLTPNALELEITESVVMFDVERALVTLHALHDLGIALSVDDFGTGYSSLAYLKRFPVSRLKIDRAFVNDAPTNADDQSIVKAILSLAKNLSLEVVAEGVETDAHHTLLQGLGCDLAQGYLFSHPLPADQLAGQWLGAAAHKNARQGD